MLTTKGLVIGYGNSLRSDDGIGIRIAETVADWQLPQVRSLAVAQLTPELAADLAIADLAIFVDAGRATERALEVRALEPEVSTISSHFSNPQALLSLTVAIYKTCPQAWWLIVPGLNFQLGDRLSSFAQEGVARSLIQIKKILEGKCTK